MPYPPRSRQVKRARGTCQAILTLNNPKKSSANEIRNRNIEKNASSQQTESALCIEKKMTLQLKAVPFHEKGTRNLWSRLPVKRLHSPAENETVSTSEFLWDIPFRYKQSITYGKETP